MPIVEAIEEAREEILLTRGTIDAYIVVVIEL